MKTEATFTVAAKKFEQEYAAITEGQRSPKWVEDYSIRLRLHLVPFFGKTDRKETTGSAFSAVNFRRQVINLLGFDIVPTSCVGNLGICYGRLLQYRKLLVVRTNYADA